ncbi:carboxylating nicotinate-nucleotide diphosphorylase [Thiomicrorhabdus aquaedulcis]|uniref:carboxylating nicotinate-nucleotide diphosphorylase n=1 Tax=Thiomicrorhabdus aquaedulcis TaxID=2211106 RepID=UPI000FD9C00E|nr:carboxylating nicotinate-nucleotide diphosphorylase [Thiomicrorhabdus aquaedulcis]
MTSTILPNYFLNLSTTVASALQEDVGAGDLTAQLIASNTQANAKIVCREAAIICGRPWFEEVFRQIDASIQIDWHITEGQAVAANQLICTLQGSARAILTAERTALNFLQTLSATATVTAQYVAQLKNTHTQLLDTRKTLPGLRLAQKYAVKCGGGCNHRMGLYDAILIKENHIMAAGGIAQAVNLAKTLHPGVSIEVETENLAEVKQALMAGANIIMLDNFSYEQMHAAVMLVSGQAKLEVSGNVEIDQLAHLAKTGVDFISSGALTKHIKAIDLSMRFEML